MKKAFFVIAILTACICNIFANTSFRMPDGTRVSGKIINVTSDAYIVETESGIITINKDDVRRMKGRTTPDFRVRIPSKDNVDYHAYKRNFNIGLGFFIPGAVFVAIPTLFCTGFAVQGLMQYDSASDKSDIGVGISCYFLSIGVGLIFELISIPFFITADKHYRKAIEQYRVSFDTGFSGESLKMAMNVSF